MPEAIITPIPDIVPPHEPPNDPPVALAVPPEGDDGDRPKRGRKRKIDLKNIQILHSMVGSHVEGETVSAFDLFGDDEEWEEKSDRLVSLGAIKKIEG